MGSVQHWMCPVPASNESGVASATATSGSLPPSVLPPILHLRDISSPHYSHPLAAKPNNSLPWRPFPRRQVFRSHGTHCHHCLLPATTVTLATSGQAQLTRLTCRVASLLTPCPAKPLPPLPKPLPSFQRNPTKPKLHRHLQTTTRICKRIRSLPSLK